MNHQYNTPQLIRLPANTVGRDWIIGDIHGHTSDAINLCKAVGVDEKNGDRVFLVGDIIDRGPESAPALGFAKLPNWYVIRGNHEQMMVESVLDQNFSITQMWLGNGGTWINTYGTEEREAMAHRIGTRIPYGIFVVGDGTDRFYVTHAEIIARNSQCVLNDELFDSDTALASINIDALLWGRRIYHYVSSSSNGREEVEQVYKDMGVVYVGHTQVSWTPHMIGNHMYLDTGCCNANSSQREYEKSTLTIACHQTRMYYQWDPLTRRIINSGHLPTR